MRRQLSACLLLIAAASPALAQPRARPAAARGGDTVRFREVNLVTIDVTTPQGPITMKNSQTGSLLVQYARTDSVVAWYDSLAVTSESPMGSNSPDVSGLLRKPYAMRVADGEVTVLSSPTLPGDMAQVGASMRRELQGFFPKSPRATTVGATWTDSVSRLDSAGGMTGRNTRVASYRVASDTTIGGVKALVIEVTARLTNQSEGTTQGMSVKNELAGTETGRYFYDPAARRLLGRERRITLTGEGGPTEMRMPMTVSTDTKVSIVR